MDLEAQDKFEIAKEAWIRGAEYAELTLGGSIPLEEIEEAFSDWLDHIG